MIVLNTPPRTGSTWLSKILQELLDKDYKFLLDFEKIKNEDGFIRTHVINPSKIQSLDNVKQIIIIRNVYDIISSEINLVKYHYDRGTLNQKSLEITNTPDEYVDIYFDEWIKNIKMFKDYDDPDVLKIDYDKITNAEKIITKICDFLQLNKNSKEIDRIAKKYPFEKSMEKDLLMQSQKNRIDELMSDAFR